MNRKCQGPLGVATFPTRDWWGSSGSAEKEQREEGTMCIRTAQGPADGRGDIHATPTPAAGPQIFNSKAGIGDSIISKIPFSVLHSCDD